MERLLLFLSIALITQACEESVERRYILKNDTNHTIEIKTYYWGSAADTVVHKGVIKLEQKGETWDTLYNESLASDVGANEVFNADSAVVLFDNEKMKIYTVKDNSTRNFLYNEAYDQNKNTYRYTFTEEDYQKADSIQ